MFCSAAVLLGLLVVLSGVVNCRIAAGGDPKRDKSISRRQGCVSTAETANHQRNAAMKKGMEEGRTGAAGEEVRD